ncbi:MAG: hypothetical protein O3C63_07560 [Cyanobacteria bacterium]|nr:hypothetical protein [Cyanobacteriota bacterium]
MPSKFFALFIAILFTSSAVIAAAIKIKPEFVFEGETIKVLANKYTSTANPLVVTLVDGEGDQFGDELEATKTNVNGFVVTAPSVSSTKTLVLRVVGGNTSSDEPDDFPVVIFDKPDLTSPNPSAPDNDLSAQNVNAEAIVLSTRSITASEAGELRWNGHDFIDKDGVLLADRLTLNGVALSVVNGTDLTWNSHTVATSAGAILASSLTGTNGATLTLTKTGAVSLETNGATTVTLPSAGLLQGVLRCEYNFAVDGGVTGNIALRNATLPVGAIVTSAFYEVLTTFTSATDATSIGITIPSDDVNGIKSPVTISNVANAWDSGMHGTDLGNTSSAVSERTTQARTIALSVSGEAITAGKLVLYAEYVMAP